MSVFDYLTTGLVIAYIYIQLWFSPVRGKYYDLIRDVTPELELSFMSMKTATKTPC